MVFFRFLWTAGSISIAEKCEPTGIVSYVQVSFVVAIASLPVWYPRLWK
jgi:hypothetical protein